MKKVSEGSELVGQRLNIALLASYLKWQVILFWIQVHREDQRDYTYVRYNTAMLV